MIKGISHITLVVKDVEKSSRLFIDIFNARVVYKSGNKPFSLSKEVYLLIDDLWIALMEGDSKRKRTYDHIAFQVAEKDLPEYEKIIEEAGLEIKKDRTRIHGEGQSVYFYDYDEHLFELHTGTLQERLEAYGSCE